MNAIHLLPLLLLAGAAYALTKPDLLLRLWPSSGPKSHGESRWAAGHETRLLGRHTRAEALLPDGIVLGWLGRHLLQTPAEDNLLCFGVQRSGKTSTVVIPTLLGWDGAVVATSIKHELFALTGDARRRRGPVYVFAPLETLPLVGRDLRAVSWNPLRDIGAAHEAIELADLLTAEQKQTDNAHWYHSAGSLIAGLVLMAGPDGDLRSVLRLLNNTAVDSYSGLTDDLPEGSVAAELIRAFAHTPEREAGSIASTARSSLSLWMDDRVARATSNEREQLDLDRLLEEGATLYLVAPAEEAVRLRPLFSALIQSLLRKATAKARAEGGVLKPRLLFALDEVANFAQIPMLATHVSTGPGQGLNWLLCFHDLAQLEQGYGSEQARTVWNNCRAHLLLPGQSDLKTLEQFSRAIGDETRSYRLSAADGSSSEQRIGKPLASVDSLRRLRDPVLLYANAPPARLHARRWDEVPAWRAQIELRRAN